MRQSPRKQLRSDLQSASPSRNRKGGSSENESDNFESPRTKRLKRGAQAESLQREESEKSDQDSDQQEDDYDQFDGDDCVDEFGNCLQGNKFRFRTFNLPERHAQRQYCAMLDLARSFGYNDSFRFMKVHPKLPRIDLTQEERDMVIEMNIIHPVMKYRNVPAISVPAAYQFFGKELFATDNGSSWWEKETNDSSSANDSNRAIIPHLKPIVPPAKQGGDWMYRCALSAAEFNVQIRSERCDRLSGKSISINDGEQEEEEEELEAPAMRKKEPTKEGFLDIHTNVYQLPRNTQMSNFRVHSLGVNLEDFSRSEPQTGEMEIYISNTNDNQVNEHIQKYPVAVIAGQYQGTLPVISSRFGYAGHTKLQSPGSANSRIMVMGGFPNNSDVKYTFDSTSSGGGSILCGHLTPSGQLCRQKVLKVGEKCYAHRAL